jgi:hypothetical protein
VLQIGYMSLLNRKSTLAILGLLASLVAMGASTTPAFANTINHCSVVGSSTITVPASGSTTVKVTVTYSDFSSGNYPMYVTASSVTPGYSINASSNFYDGGSGTHVFTLKVTNTNPSVTSGTATLKVNWTPSGGVTEPIGCGTLTIRTGADAPPGVPQFPAGMALLMALAIPALLLVRSRSKIIAA